MASAGTGGSARAGEDARRRLNIDKAFGYNACTRLGLSSVASAGIGGARGGARAGEEARWRVNMESGLEDDVVMRSSGFLSVASACTSAGTPRATASPFLRPPALLLRHEPNKETNRRFLASFYLNDGRISLSLWTMVCVR